MYWQIRDRPAPPGAARWAAPGSATGVKGPRSDRR